MLAAIATEYSPCIAATYVLSDQRSDVIGGVDEVIATADDTLLDIARRFDLGYNEIVAANPDIDPWLPTAGVPVIVPAYFILPGAPRNGIVINLAEMRLYYYPPHDQASSDTLPRVMTYPIGIGQEGWSTPIGVSSVMEKIPHPAWTVPDSIIAQYAQEGQKLAKIMPPGPDNPLGEYALRLENPRFLIHGTNKPFGVGRRVSHGCIRMYPEDIDELFHLVTVGTRVWIIDQPYKIGQQDSDIMMEAHDPITGPGAPASNNLVQVIATATAITKSPQKSEVSEIAMQVALQHSGIPRRITHIDTQPEVAAGWLLQVGAFTDISNAFSLADHIAELNEPVSVKVRANDGYCHVLVGPYANQESAMDVNARLERATGITGKLLPADRYGITADCMP